jgi:GNAT superfamily N-acetyltransferase
MVENDAQYLIRPASEADQAGILNCLAVAFEPYRGDYAAEAFADTVLNPVTFRERLQKMHILVATSESKNVGTIAGKCDGKEGHLRGMAVLPEWKGTGLAVRLLLTMEAWLQKQGCNRVSLDTTLPLKAAMRFYEKNGYIRSGKISDFFGMPLLEYVKEL